MLWKKENIHGYQERIEKYKLFIQKSELSQKNKERLFNYLETGFYNKSAPTALKVIQCCFLFLKWIKKDFEEITKKDTEKWVSWLYHNEKYSSYTVEKYLVTIKLFFRIQHGLKKGKYPNEVEWIETAVKHSPTKNIEDLPTMEEIKSVLEKGCLNSRDKCILALLVDTGARISEIGNMQIKDLKEEENYLILDIKHSKTMPRTLVSYLSVPYVKRWLAEHPKIDESNSPLFIEFGRNDHSIKLKYSSYRQLLIRAFNRAGIKERKFNPHIFRHLFVTRTAPHFSRGILNYWLGWSGRGADQLVSNVYGHFNYKSVIEPYFSMLEKEKNSLMPIQCNCGLLNPNQEFCYKCGNDLKKLTLLSSAEKRLENELKERIFNQMSVEDLSKFIGKIVEEKLEKNIIKLNKAD